PRRPPAARRHGDLRLAAVGRAPVGPLLPRPGEPGERPNDLAPPDVRRGAGRSLPDDDPMERSWRQRAGRGSVDVFPPRLIALDGSGFNVDTGQRRSRVRQRQEAWRRPCSGDPGPNASRYALGLVPTRAMKWRRRLGASRNPHRWAIDSMVNVVVS